MTTANVAVILLSFLTLAHAQQLKTRNFDSGLYFEETGKVFFYNREWKIVSNVNLTEYHNELSTIRYVVDVIKNHCEELKLIEMEKNASVKSNEGCGPALFKLNFLMAEIEENDSYWLGKDKRRAKRNAFSELVSADWPNDFSTFFNEFANMSAHGIETSTSSDKQTSYIISTMNSVGKLSENHRITIEAYVTSQLSQVHNTLISARNGSANAIRMFQLRTTISDIISYQELILNSFASKQKQYLRIMSLVGVKNALIPTMMSTSNLLTELNKIRAIVSEIGFGFPKQLTPENVHYLFRLSSPEISLFRDQIFFTFKVPLISKLPGNHFNLYKVTSALHNIGEHIYSFVIPDHEIIAIDAHKEQYFTLTVDDLNKCSQTSNESMTLCKQTSAPTSVRTSSECEIMVLLKYQYSDSCNRRYIRNYANIFVKVMQPNTWLVTMANRNKVRYLCEGQEINETLTQMNGLLTIGANCKFFTDDVTIFGDNTHPKRSVRERIIGNLELGQRQNISLNIVESNKYFNFASNHIAQVVGFGETEKLFRISYSENDVKIMKTLGTEDERFLKLTKLEYGLLFCLIVLILWIVLYIALTYSISNKRFNDPKLLPLTTRPSAPSLTTTPSMPSITTKPPTASNPIASSVPSVTKL